MDSTLSSPLLATLGKRGRAEVLGTLYKYPKRRFTVNELARESHTAVMTCWRAVREFEGLGMVTVDRVGKAFAVGLNEESRVVRGLRDMKILDPYREGANLFAATLSRVEGVDECYLFGSVARGRHRPESDIDIAVVYDEDTISREDVEKESSMVAKEILQRTRMRIVPLCLSKRNKDKPLWDEIVRGKVLWRKERS
jgi:predicted nucleotidyltransferase